jgi:biotin carboxyl carrier protein
VRDLEALMEESLHQDDEIVWPSPADALVVAREHGQYAGRAGVPFLVSLPLRARGRPVAVIQVQRREREFSPAELALLRVWCDQSAPWLALLHRHGSGWWMGLREGGREALGKLWSIEHAWAKLGVAVAALALLGATFGTTEYRVDAPFILRSAEQVLLPAPFDGFVQTVPRDIGDAVAAGEVLLTLDETPLRQREAALLADSERFRGEAERAESATRFAELRIAQAQLRQTRAELEIVRHQLAAAVVKSPLAGVVVEGRWRERVGAAVRQGDLLFRVARLDTVHAEIAVDERDIQRIAASATGELAFASRPGEDFRLRVTRIEPAGTARDGANLFLVRAALPGSPPAWWRPGMTGVAKIEAGRRSYAWIATHRLIDFLRLRLWWW